VRRQLVSYLRHQLRQLDATAVLAVVGVAIGAANIIALISVTDTGRQRAVGMMREYGADTVFIVPYLEGDSGFMLRANAGAFMPERYLSLVAEVAEVDAVTGVLMLPAHVGVGTERVFTTIEGATPAYLDVRGHALQAGRFFTEEEEAQQARVCCLGHLMPEALYGAEDPLGQQLVLKGERYTVIGVMIEKGVVGLESMDQRIYIPLSTAQEVFELPGLHTVMARARESLAAEDVAAAIEQRLRDDAELAPEEPASFTVSTMEDLTGAISEALAVFRVLLLGVGSVALLVAGIGIMNVMLMQVIARTREIGIRRAVGARRRDIWLQFLTEAVGQALAGALAGVVVGIAGSLAFCLIVGWEPRITAATLLLAVTFSLATGVVFGVYPAVHAARLKPIDCLRYE
jgi:putative ABC transport system permease protein